MTTFDRKGLQCSTSFCSSSRRQSFSHCSSCAVAAPRRDKRTSSCCPVCGTAAGRAPHAGGIPGVGRLRAPSHRERAFGSKVERDLDQRRSGARMGRFFIQTVAVPADVLLFPADGETSPEGLRRALAALRLTFIVPVYNEAATVAGVLDRVNALP